MTSFKLGDKIIVTNSSMSEYGCWGTVVEEETEFGNVRAPL